MKDQILELISIKKYHSVQEIMEALNIPKEDILEVKHILEDGIDSKEIERAFSGGKPWYRKTWTEG